MKIRIEDLQTSKILTERETEVVAGGNNIIAPSTGDFNGDGVFEPNYTPPYSRGYGDGYSRGYVEAKRTFVDAGA